MNNLSVSAYGNRSKKHIAFTFDDGPNPYFTKKILDVLESFDVKATFFVVGTRCMEYPKILLEIIEKGHLIGNHTYSHKAGDFELCNKTIFDISQYPVRYMRPPFYDVGLCQDENDFLKDKLIITGDVDAKDYLEISSDEVVSNVLSCVKNGSIIDFHDGSEINKDLETRAQKTVDALPHIINNLKDQFDIVRIDKMDLEIKKYSF